MRHPPLAPLLGALLATALGAQAPQPPTDTTRRDSTPRSDSARADSVRPPRPNPRLRPRPTAPLPRRPAPTGSGIKVRKDAPPARDTGGARRP